MKWLMNILAIILVLVGIVWVLQGINVLPGSFMSGQLLYAVLGIILDVIGAALLVLNNRRRKDMINGDRSRMDH